MNQPNAVAATASRSRQLLLALLMFGFVSIAVLLLGEFVVRVFAPQPASWLDIYRLDPELPIHAAQPNLVRPVDTGETHWTIATDDRGFRVASPPAAAAASAGSPARATVFAIGDSFTFGHGVNYEDGFIGQLERREPELRFVNSALPGYGPIQYRRVLERELSHDASGIQLLLVGTFLGNDFIDCIRSQSLASIPVHGGVLGDPGGVKSAIKRNSHLYRLLAKAYHLVAPAKDEDQQANQAAIQKSSWEPGGAMQQAGAIYEREFARMAELAKAKNVPLLVVVIPARQTLEARRDRSDAAGVDSALPVEFVTGRFEALGIPFLDMTPVFAAHETKDLYFAYDGHLTKLGNALVSEAIAQRIPAMLAPAASR